MRVTFVVSQAYRRAQFILGREVAEEHTLHFPGPVVSAELRAQVAALCPTLTDLCLSTWAGQEQFRAPLVPSAPEEWATLFDAYRAWQQDLAERRAAKGLAYLTGFIAEANAYVPTLDALGNLARAPWLSTEYRDLPDYAAAQAAAERAQGRQAAALAELRRARDAEAAAEEAARAARRAAKAAWIAAHGSDFLQRAHGAGYDCQTRYVVERAAAEYPGYVVDRKDEAAWRNRSCPSAAALAEAERTGGTVVWLTEPVPAADAVYGDHVEPTEAVVVTGFLGNYTLVKTFDAQQTSGREAAL